MKPFILSAKMADDMTWTTERLKDVGVASRAAKFERH